MRQGTVHLADSPLIPFMSLEEAKSFLKVDFSDEDDLIEGLVAAAVGDCEAWCDAAFVPRTVVVTQRDFADYCRPAQFVQLVGAIHLPIHPLLSVASVAYLDAEGETQTVDEGSYVAVSSQRPPYIVPAPGKSWPSVLSGHPEAVTITLRAGFEELPKNLVAAVSFRLAQLYRNRDEGELEMPASSQSLLRPFQLWRLP